MKRFLSCLFLLGTALCSIPAQASERHSDSVCTFEPRTSAGLDHLHLLEGRIAREQESAERAASGHPTELGRVVETPKTPLTAAERAELKQAIERFARKNRRKVIDIRREP